MKLNNKGFAITSILYAVLILFLSLIAALLMLMGNRKLVLDKYKNEVKENLNNSAETYGARVQIASDATYVRIYENEFLNYDFKSNVSGCLNSSNGNSSEDSLCSSNETDITHLLNYKVYDEAGNEVISFTTDVLSGENDFKAEVVKYTYYAKDENGNYILSADGKSLKVVTDSLKVNKENMFFIKYYVVDNNNILSKEATRTLVILKYNNYIHVKNNYFKVTTSGFLTYDFKVNADSYKLENNTLVKDNTLLNYVIFNANDEKIIEFKELDGKLYYNCEGDSCKEDGVHKDFEVTSDERFRVRYFTGSLETLKSEENYAYFSVE